MNLAHLTNFIKHSILVTFLGAGEEKKNSKHPQLYVVVVIFGSSGNRLFGKRSISQLAMQRLISRIR